MNRKQIVYLQVTLSKARLIDRERYSGRFYPLPPTGLRERNLIGN